METFVEPEWLESVAGKDFFYPAAFMDIAPFVCLLAPYVTRFICNGPFYDSCEDRRSPVPDGFHLVDQAVADPSLRDRPVEDVLNVRIPYRNIDPSTLHQVFSDGCSEITVMRRRGFGQYALLERPARSIGVFTHRFDTPYEGGSNVWFLANRPKDHEPLANLWSKLSSRLADRALVISDGSLTDFRFLFPDGSISSLDDYRNRRAAEPIIHDGFTWTCAGFLPGRGHSLIWGLERI
jgi:hypothetical protein